MSYGLQRHPLNGMYPKRTPIKPKTHSPNNQDNRVFTFLDEKLLKQLEKYAEDYKIKKSQVLRTALVSYLRSNGYDKDVEQTRRL